MRIALLAFLLLTTPALAQSASPPPAPGKTVSWKELQELFVSGEQPTRPDAFGELEQNLDFLLCVAVDGKVRDVRALTEAPADELEPMLATLRTWRYMPPREPLCAKLSWTFHAPQRLPPPPPLGRVAHFMMAPQPMPAQPTPQRPGAFRGKAQTLMFKVCVNADGSVKTVDPIGTMPDNERDALAAVLRKWRYHPQALPNCYPLRLDYDQ